MFRNLEWKCRIMVFLGGFPLCIIWMFWVPHSEVVIEFRHEFVAFDYLFYEDMHVVDTSS
jgi:hypothetical protein